MSELSPQARAALRALGSVEPSTADERRVREGLERAVGVALPVAAVIGAAAVGSTSAAAATGSTGAVTATGASVSAAGFTALGTGAKVMLFVAAVGVGSVVTAGVKAVVPPSQPLRSAAAQQAPAPARRSVAPVGPVAPVAPVADEPIAQEPVGPPEAQPVAAAPAPVMPVSGSPRVRASKRAEPELEVSADESVVAPSPTIVVSEPAPSAPALPAAPPTPQSATTEEGFALVVEAHFPDCNPATEIRTAQAARKLLVEQRPEHALFLIGAYQKHCPSGQWSDEAWRVRLSSLCTLGRSTEASSLFEWFATEYPHRRFAIESELRSTCEPSVLGND